MRYKVEKVKMRTNKWGYIISSEGQEYSCSTLEEALELAKRLANKKCTVNVYDMKGTEYEGGSTWLICSFERGVVYNNNNYK